MPEATARIPVMPATRNNMSLMCPKNMTYDKWISKVIEFIKSNKIPMDIILENRPILWIQKEEIVIG